MRILVIGRDDGTGEVRHRLLSDGFAGITITGRDALPPETELRRHSLVLLLDDCPGEGPENLCRVLASLVGRGLGTLVLLGETRSPEFLEELFQGGAGDALLWPRDAAFLKPRIAGLLRRSSGQHWPTSLESELRLLHSITLAVSEAESFAAAMQAVLRMICEATGWILGQAWIRGMGSTGLQCSPAWHSRVPGLDSFRAATEKTSFEFGGGLPGQVWATQQRTWVDDVSVDARFVRGPAAREVGLKAGFFVPILADGQVMSVLEFFAFEKRREDERLLDLVSGLAMQLGSMIERKRLEEAYRLLNAAIQQMGESILITTAEVNQSWPEIIFANAAFSALTGYSRAELLGGSPQLLFGPAVDNEILGRFRDASSEGRILQGETVSQRKDGTEFDLDWRVAPVRDNGGGIRHLIANLRDITDRKRVERSRERLEHALNKAAVEWRQTFDAMESAIWILDGQRKIRRLNRAAQQLSHCSFEENLGRRIESVAPGEPWHTAGALITSLKREGTAEVLREEETTGRTWQIGARTFRTQGALEGNEELILLIVRDVTPMIQLQDTLRRSQTMAAMGSLVAGVAHEVRNPLFGISATLDAFEARFGSQQDFRTYSDVLRGQVDRLNALMGELLEYGKQPTQERSEGHLADVVAHALKACAPMAEKSGIRVAIALPPDLPAFQMDFGRLVQVFQNLIANAIQHSPDQATVTLEAAVEHKAGGRSLRCLVADTGTGFRPEDLPRVFEPFFTRRPGGTGLGLSIVHRILEQHGGQAVACNRPEGGALITVHLPLPAVDAPKESPRAA